MSTKGKEPFTISRKEAAKKMKVSTRTLDRYIKKKKLSSKNIAGRIFLNIEEVTAFAKKKRKHRSVGKKKSYNKTVRAQEVPDVLVESDVDFVSKVENRIYKNLYDEVQSDLKGFQQRLEGANYRVGQLEAQLESSVPLPEHQKLLIGHKKERYNKRILYLLLAVVLGLQPLWLLLVYL